MRRWALRILAAFGIVAAAVVLRATVFAPQPLVVEVVEVGRGTVEEAVTNSRAGTVRVRRRARLSPQIGGTVVELAFREGSRVSAGDVVLRLDDRLHKARLRVAEGDLAAAVAEIERPCLESERAARELERARGLVGSGILSTDRLDQVESLAASNAAACRAARVAEGRARSAVTLAEAELALTVLRAPFDGVVADLATEVGEYSTPSPPAVPVPPALDVMDPSSIYVSAPMDEVDSARIAPDQAVRVTVDSHRGRELAGRVVRVAPYVLDREEQNRTVEIEVELDDEAFAATLLPGTSADVEVILEARAEALRVPTASLLEGRRVLVLDSGVLRSVEVEAGLSNWDFTEIRKGLAGGERVVTSLDRAEVRAGAAAGAAEDGS